MNYIKTVLITFALFFSVSAEIDTSSQHFYMFSYFKQHETDGQYLGTRLALSTDGVTWEKYNNEVPIIVPETHMVGKAGGRPLMRDPNIYFDNKTGVFHLTWTTQWVDDVIGYAYSKDLKHWSTQIKVPVGEKIRNCGCCWAPEFFYDDTKDSVMVLWSTDRDVSGKEAFCSYTKDFKTYTYPELYFEPKTSDSTKYSIIDETILKVADKKYYLFYKDERVNKGLFPTQVIHCTVGETPRGPWWRGTDQYEGGSAPMTPIGYEGPTAYIIGDEVRVVSDPFNTPELTKRVKTVKIADLQGAEPPAKWNDGLKMVTTEGLDFLPSHGSISEIPKAKVLQLLHNIPDPTVYPNSWTNITKEDIKVLDTPVEETTYPLGKRNCGCGTGVGLAFIPPLFFKGWTLRRRKKQDTKSK